MGEIDESEEVPRTGVSIPSHSPKYLRDHPLHSSQTQKTYSDTTVNEKSSVNSNLKQRYQ